MLVAIEKYEFFTRKIDFIRFIIKLGYISIDLKKVKAIVDWQELENVI
jgi:menaquinone-dependent protoporphyrinogen IX oxidase